MRRVSTFTRATLTLLATGCLVSEMLGATFPGGVSPQTPPSATAASQPSTKPTGDALYARGRARLQAGDLAAAATLLGQAVAQCPENRDYVLELAQVQALRQDWPAVRKLLSPLERELDADGLILLANAYAKIQRPKRATKILEQGLRRRPDSEVLWLALIDRALESQQCGTALEQVGQAQHHLGATPQLQFRAARAHFRLGRVLGATRVIHVPGGRVGQFVQGGLLVERRDGDDRFLCCPPASAWYALRRALDAGLDEPAAHRLHARIWQQAGRPEIGLAILQSREELWLENPSVETLSTCAELALAANALDEFLRYTRLQAAREPQRRTKLLFEAFTSAAERYNQRGDATMSRELLRRAVELRPGDVGVMLRLADAAWDAGGRDEAVVWYRRVLEREPGHSDRLRILRRLDE